MLSLDNATDPALRAALKLAERELPGFQIRHKASSRMMRFVDRFARLFSPLWLTGYHTTFGRTIFLAMEPENALKYQKEMVPTVLHEMTHMVDRRNMGSLRFTLSYAFPQVLALLALPVVLLPALLVLAIPDRGLGIVGLALGLIASIFLWAWLCPWVLLTLVALLALLPWPSRGRTHIERRGYKMTAAVHWWLYGGIYRTPEQTAKLFTGWAYYRMCPNREKVIQMIEADHRDIRGGRLSEDRWFAMVGDALP